VRGRRCPGHLARAALSRAPVALANRPTGGRERMEPGECSESDFHAQCTHLGRFKHVAPVNCSDEFCLYGTQYNLYDRLKKNSYVMKKDL
jgi:hypothetical protein